MLLISAIITVIALIVGSITDFKKREVPDYLSYSLIFIGFGISIIYSILFDNTYILQTLQGFAIGIALAYAMFYLGQWGGGDSKVLIGVGTILGFNIFNAIGEKNFLLLMFLGGIIIIGSIYGLFFSAYLAIKNKEKFFKSAKFWMEKKYVKISRRILLVFTSICLLVIIFIVPNEYKFLLLPIVAVLFFIFYIWLFVKIVEESCMIKKISVDKLTEGDWINENIYIKNKLIVGPKDLGISKEQIRMLKKNNIKYVLVKEGIPFIPVFLLSFVLTLLINYFDLLNLGVVFLINILN